MADRLCEAVEEPLALGIIHALEETPAPGQKPIEWFLLTTLDVNSPEHAKTIVGWYCLRRRIEDWHRVLKSGCRIEELQYETAERLRSALAINIVIAWRIMLLTLLGRETPELPPEVFFSDDEIEVLAAYAQKRKHPPPDTLGATTFLIAKMGGYMACTHDPRPGHQIMWRSYAFFRALCVAYDLLRPT